MTGSLSGTIGQCHYFNPPEKNLEKYVHDRISKFFENTNFISPNQGGFHKGYSTVTTIADLTDDLFNCINKGYMTLATFISLQKASDTVNPDTLRTELFEAWIRNSAPDM